MFQYILRRVLISIPVLLGVTFLCFTMIYFAPGDATELSQNPNATEADRELRKEMLGLNDPFLVQYVHWLGDMVQGDLGTSFIHYQPVANLLFERLGPTMILAASALIFAYIIAVPLGVLSALKQYSWIDYTATTGAFIGVSIPNFFFGLGAIYIFGVVLGILPTGGMNDLGDPTFGGLIRHLILPTVTLGLAIAGGMIRYVRSSVLEVLGQEYLRTARAKGLKEFVVITKHAMKNTLLPIITVVAMDIPMLIAGAVVTETIFQWPGMGQLTIQSILSRDYPTLMAINLIASVSVFLANIWSDIMYAVVDPRIKYD